MAHAAPAESDDMVSGERSVTLITGDRVVVDDTHSAVRTIVPAKGREAMTFITQEREGHSFVVPRDALPLLGQGKLDKRLFDVTQLLRFGYDDAHSPTLPLIVKYAPEASRTQNRLAGATVKADLSSVHSSAVSAAKTGAIWSSLTRVDAVRHVRLDGKVRSTLDKSVVQIGAPAAWQAGYTGAGVKVAVVDTGVDQSHPDLAGREIAEQNFSEDSDAVDRNGHGTHVASTIAGTGAKSGGKYKGVAPDAQIIDAKVLDSGGIGSESTLLSGIQWAVDQGARVVNISVGSEDTPGVDPVEEAVNTLSAQRGTLFVIAAGNVDGAVRTISSPGSADAALTVGAVDRADEIAGFSNRGPRVGDGAIKPDVTAPGTDIVAAQATEGYIGTPVADGYVALSGTSMATPHTAGAAALLAQQHTGWRGEEIKKTLVASAKPTPKLTVFDQGAGRIDVARAITQTVTSTPVNLNFGVQQWPHDDDQPTSQAVTYRNSGSAAATVDLAADVTGPDGKAAPAGMVTVSPARLTIPASGEAKATVTANTRIGTLDGRFTGAVVATANGASARTPVAVEREVESYNLTIKHTAVDGNPLPSYFLSIVDLDRETLDYLDPFGSDGVTRIRLRKGHYTMESTSSHPGEMEWLVYPSLRLDRETTLDFDYRLAKPISITPPQPLNLQMGSMGLQRTFTSGRKWDTGVRSDATNLRDVLVAQIGPSLPPGNMATQVHSQWTADNGDFYGLAWVVPDFPTGFTRVVKQTDLTQVTVDLGTPLPGRSGIRQVTAYPKSGEHISLAAALNQRVPLPSTQTEYYTRDVAWSREIRQINGNRAETSTFTAPRQYPAARIYQESHNRGVFGPVLPSTRVPGRWVSRQGDTLEVFTPLFGDGAGNWGLSQTDSGNTALYRDGQLIDSRNTPGEASLDMPAGAGTYRLAVEGVRTDKGVSDVSTKVAIAWTFTSSPGTARLPISTVRYTPALDNDNAAPKGQKLTVPVAVQSQGTDQGQPPQSLTVEASYDSGATWQAVPVVSNALAVLDHPNTVGTVSLRAKAVDRDGGIVEQTIINAYKIR
nr:S8 family serine peptidase [Kibdelosporangium sp. MJ126-NF4]